MDDVVVDVELDVVDVELDDVDVELVVGLDDTDVADVAGVVVGAGGAATASPIEPLTDPDRNDHSDMTSTMAKPAVSVAVIGPTSDRWRVKPIGNPSSSKRYRRIARR